MATGEQDMDGPHQGPPARRPARFVSPQDHAAAMEDLPPLTEAQRQAWREDIRAADGPPR